METVAEVLNDANSKIQKSFEALKNQFAGLRTGKANPAMVDGVQAEAWGSKQPLKNIATISTPEPRQIKITPFDPTTIDGIMKAILAANLGVTPQSDGKVVRITVPELNEERRKEIVKQAKTQAEDQKVEMRNVKENGEWVQKPYFTVDDSLPYGHGEKSVYMLSGFMKLTREEAMAINWHMGGFDLRVQAGSYDYSKAYNKYPLALMIHLADMQATFLDEATEN